MSSRASLSEVVRAEPERDADTFADEATPPVTFTVGEKHAGTLIAPNPDAGQLGVVAGEGESPSIRGADTWGIPSELGTRTSRAGTVQVMPSFAFNVIGAVLTAQLVDSIGQYLKPFSLDSHHESRETYRSWRDPKLRPDGMSDGTVEDYIRSEDHIIGAGGDYELGPGAVTDKRGITRSWNSPGEANLSFFDDVAHAVVTIRVSSWEETEVRLEAGAASVQAEITAPENLLETIAERVQVLVYAAVDQSRIMTALPPFKVFIAHGGDRKWEVVRDYVAQEYDVVAFESDDRVGQATLEVVENMISESSVAIIVLTGVDRLETGRLLARQNVIHELGFAHGRLGARNTIILLEDGTEEPSNIASINQVRFRTGEIHTTREGVLAALANRKRDRES